MDAFNVMNESQGNSTRKLEVKLWFVDIKLLIDPSPGMRLLPL